MRVTTDRRGFAGGRGARVRRPVADVGRVVGRQGRAAGRQGQEGRSSRPAELPAMGSRRVGRGAQRRRACIASSAIARRTAGSSTPLSIDHRFSSITQITRVTRSHRSVVYIELHTASAFSFLQGASLPEALVERAADARLSRARAARSRRRLRRAAVSQGRARGRASGRSSAPS